MAEPVIPSTNAWKRVSEAVKLVEGGSIGFVQGPRDPYYSFYACPVKITGAAVDGFYPAVTLAWDDVAEDWVEVEECYVKQE